MSSNTVFFKRHVVKAPHAEYSYVNVEGDLFYALAVTLMDQCKSGVRPSDYTIKKILEAFARYFPDKKINQGSLPPIECIRLMVNSPRTSEMIAYLGYVLRQLTVDEALAHPLMYSELFHGLTRKTPKDFIRQMKHALPVQCLAALASSLDVSISLSIQEFDHELRALTLYGTHEFELTIELQDQAYLARVKNEFGFEHVGESVIGCPAPVVLSTEQTMADILDVIARNQDQLVKRFVKNKTRLKSMILDNELDRKALLELYITYLPEPQSTRLLLDLEQKQEKRGIGHHKEILSSEQYMDRALLCSLASGLALGTINEQEFFDAPVRKGHHSSPAA